MKILLTLPQVQGSAPCRDHQGVLLSVPSEETITWELAPMRHNRASMEFTSQQLNQYDGSVPSKPIYMAVRGRIFDVTAGKSFYGPGGPYGMFAGKDASRALAKMSKNEEDVCASLDGLSEKEIGVLNDWEKKFEAKYPIVGRVVS
ncbi:unnamed protein product [Camellia sinensis]